jgi:TatD DNase family protein
MKRKKKITNISQMITPSFFDTHCHFDFEIFDGDRELLWQTCQKQGVIALMVPAVTPQFWPRVKQLHADDARIYYALGWHPCWITETQDSAIDLQVFEQQLKLAAQSEGCVAIGECGLDLLSSDRLIQQLEVLRVHLDLAKQLNMPVIFHCRRAHNQLIRFLKQCHFKQPGVIHAFNGSYEIAMQYIKMGLSLGVGGSITYERANKTREAFKKVPLEQLVLETDAPDMPLCGFQGHRNSPLQIIGVAECLAGLRGQTLVDIANTTTRNAQQLFGLTRHG